jgi:hypothetical protein
MPDAGFKGFSCLSLLYAQHAWLMRRISDTYSGEIALFLDDVRDQTAQLLLPRKLQETITSDGCRFWWIGSPHDSSRRRIYVRVDPRLPEIVWPGELHAEVRCGTAWRDVADSVGCKCARASVCAKPVVEQTCVIRYEEGNAVDAAADGLANLLLSFEPLLTAPARC